ncbi:MAG: rhombosortase [Woeseia sp.]
MGLAPDHKIQRYAAKLAAGGWQLPLAIAIVALIAEAGGDAWREVLRYDRIAVGQSEWWRLLSGHLVHLGWSHLAMNVLALLGIWLLVGRNLRIPDWLLAGAVIVAGIDAGFWWREPQLIWYVGLSGALHGILVAGLIAGWHRHRGEAVLLGGLLVAKLVYEQYFGALPGSAATAGGDVVVNAHLYGALAGLLAIVAVRVRVAALRSI